MEVLVLVMFRLAQTGFRQSMNALLRQERWAQQVLHLGTLVPLPKM
jgi:hypothetical protein